jgi:hypothetical protein
VEEGSLAEALEPLSFRQAGKGGGGLGHAAGKRPPHLEKRLLQLQTDIPQVTKLRDDFWRAYAS